MKHTFFFLLLGMLSLSIYNCGNGFAEASKSKEQAKSKAVQSVSVKIDTMSTQRPIATGKIYVYYFMTSYRCPSCLKIEKFTHDEVKATFSEELKSGRMEWQMLNIQEPQNEHFIKEYGLYSKSVVVSCVKNGKEIGWKNLEKIWELLGDENAFKAYIREQIKAFQKECAL